MTFLSDNISPAHPQILAALERCNGLDSHGYGDEGETARLKTALSGLFETEVWVYPVVTGTAANALILASLCPPHGAVLCHQDAHIETDECGAPEFFTGGAKLRAVAGEAGKLTPDGLSTALARYIDMVHMVRPSALSITQSSELGRVYTPEELKALTGVAKTRGLACHMDGARFANACAHLGVAPAEITWKVGIDALSFGATKNGALAAEAAIFFKEDLIGDFEYRRKRAGHLLSKQHFVSAQLNAYVEGDLWLNLARQANAAAQIIARAAGPRLRTPAEANELFVTLNAQEKASLRADGFCFYDWGAIDEPLARFVTPWNTPQNEAKRLAKALEGLDQ